MSSKRTASPRESQRGEADEEKADQACKRILVVDDDPSVREMLSRVLVAEGYRALVAGNGAEALRICTVVRPDLVLLDLNMPVKSGWDTFERLTREDPWLPIVIITARPNQLFTALG